MINLFNQAKLNNKNLAMHIYNMVFFVMSYCTYKTHDSTICSDPSHENFLAWILYGNLIIYGIALIFLALLKTGLLDVCTEKCFNAVCVAINTMGFFGGMVIYNMISMIYSLILYFGSLSSKCLELELFTKFSAYVIVIFFCVNFCILVSTFLSNKLSKRNNELSEDYYYEMDNRNKNIRKK